MQVVSRPSEAPNKRDWTYKRGKEIASGICDTYLIKEYFKQCSLQKTTNVVLGN